HFPTYRSYVDETARAEADQAWFDRALEGARSGYGHVAEHNDEDMGQDLSDLSEALLTQLDQWLGREAARSADAREAIRRFQQLTPPLAAKSLEDTVFYRYGCLLSRNEVGSDPSVFAITTDTFHDTNVRRANGAPYGLLATAT